MAVAETYADPTVRFGEFVAVAAATMATQALMEPVGAVAGVAASLQGFISTFFGALIGGFIGRQFNGTTELGKDPALLVH
jgi:hypothetical protein